MTTENIVITYKDKEVMLEVNATKGYPATRHSPEEPPEFEIQSAVWRDGENLSDEEIDYIDKHLYDQVWQALEDMAEYTRDDYLLEKYEDRARERRHHEG